MLAAWCASNGADDGAASVIFEDASKTDDGVRMCLTEIMGMKGHIGDAFVTEFKGIVTG